MNAMGLALIGCLVRGSLFAALGLAMGAALRRRGPAAGALASLATLAGLTAVSGLALSPWPRWWSLAPPPASPATVPPSAAGPLGGVPAGSAGVPPAIEAQAGRLRSQQKRGARATVLPVQGE